MVKKTYLIEGTNDKVTMTSINENAALDAKRQFELTYEVSLIDIEEIARLKQQYLWENQNEVTRTERKLN